MTSRVVIKTPGTTANMGPGFDSLGMALDIWNSIQVEVGSSGFFVHGEGEDSLPSGHSNLVYGCFSIPFERSGDPVPEVTITCQNKIPLSRGLGSSSATAVGALMAGNEICGRPLSQQDLLDFAARTDGHPDNVAPALLGGCQIVVSSGDHLLTAAVPIPQGLRTVIFVPDLHMSTKEMRTLLTAKVARQDTVYNIGRVGLLVAAFATGDFTHLAVATEDRLHQPARQTLFPAMKNIFRAALSAGALGVFLSGSGPSVLALTRGREMTIGYEMAEAAAKSGVGGTFKVTQPTSRGAHVVTRE